MESQINDIIVSIHCLAYNHVDYIRQCLDGFMMQKTNFRFEAIVHDDASTDGTAEIIKEYAEKYPDIIKPILEKENVYSKHIPGLLTKIMDEKCSGKYIAICEGDDYWIDPLKLQKQVDYMEAHPECAMTCTRTKLYSEKEKRYYAEQYCRKKDGIINLVDIVNRTGLYISTCSIIYRREIMRDYPDYCKKCRVGDYPLQIYCAMKGTVFYFDKAMSVYRRDNPNSWMGQQDWGRLSAKRLEIIQSRVKMLKGFMHDFPRCQKIFEEKIADEINRNVPNRQAPKEDVDKYLSYFVGDINNYSTRWMIDLAIRKCRIPKVRYWYTKYFMKKYTYMQTFCK